MSAHFKSLGAPLSSRYLTHRQDLNADGLDDALILMRAPYGYWCGTEGCPLFVAKGTPRGFDVISKTKPVREPVCVLNTSTGSWRNLIVRVAGRSARPKDVMLQNKGNGYPANPNDLTPILSSFSGQSICAFHTEKGGAYARAFTAEQSMIVPQSNVIPYDPMFDKRVRPAPSPYSAGRVPPPYDPDYIPEMKEPINNSPFINEYDPAYQSAKMQ